MRLPDGRGLYTATCRIRTKWPSRRCTQLYQNFDMQFINYSDFMISFRIYISCPLISFSHRQQTYFSKCYSDIQSTKNLGRCRTTYLNLSRTEISIRWSLFDISYLIIYISFPTSPFLHTNWPGKNKIGLFYHWKQYFWWRNWDVDDIFWMLMPDA